MAEASEKDQSDEERRKNAPHTSELDEVESRQLHHSNPESMEVSADSVSSKDTAGEGCTAPENSERDPTHVVVVKENNRSPHASATPAQNTGKSPKATAQQAPVARPADAVAPQESVGKRRRVQHDYRRLSSSGYVDDDYFGRERRFSSTSESDAPGLSPTQPKSKSSKGKGSQSAEQINAQHAGKYRGRCSALFTTTMGSLPEYRIQNTEYRIQNTEYFIVTLIIHVM